MRVRSSGRSSPLALLVLAAAALTAAAAPAPAFAEEPVSLDGAYVLDSAGVLGDRADDVQRAVDALYDEAGIQLFVVYVDSFSGAPDAAAWADATAERNSLGQDDVLLAVATEDRNYAVSYPADFRLDDGAQIRVETESLEPELRQDDWAGAAIAAAQGYSAAANPGFPLALGVVLALLGLAAVAVVVFLIVRARRRSAEARGKADDLDRRAAATLVQLDDAVRTSEQELGFAIAQFGEGATTEFAAALAGAKAKLREAFEIRQRLDDAFPESEEEKNSWTNRILELCTDADAELDAQADAFDELRALEQNAPAVLEQVAVAHAAAGTRLPGIRATVERLGSRYSAAAVAPVAENAAQAEKLLGLAGNALQEARQQLSGSSSGRAVVAIRAAQASAGQAAQLLDAVDARATELATAEERVAAARTDLRDDLAEARTLPATPPLDAALREAESVLTTAGDTPGDPITTLVDVERVRAALDASVTTTRTEQERARRAAASLDRAIAAARAQVDSAAAYIDTRRGAIAASARTRLAEAERHLFTAMSQGAVDPVGALAQAERANSLAAQAIASAQHDTETFAGSPLGYRGNSGSDLEGAILGGLLGYLGGGSRSRGSIFGGGSWTSPQRSRSSGGFGGGFSGGFGGTSRSSGSRGGGMRSSRSGSSGGRRSRGGRF